MDDADQHPVRSAEYALKRVVSRSRDGVADFRHCEVSLRRAGARIAPSSSRDGKDARTPFRVTEIEAASIAGPSASFQLRPRALVATKTPQNTSPAPTVSMAMTSGAAT